LRIAVASPFVDRQHGTERALAELLERLAGKYGCQIDLYAQRVEDLGGAISHRTKGKAQSVILWRRVPSVPGPHIFRFAWWFLSNQLSRRWDKLVGCVQYDLVFSPGINCLDADAILVHAVFQKSAELQRSAALSGVRALHRRIYYGLVCYLERQIYTNPNVTLAAVSPRTAAQLRHFFGRDDVTVIPNGVDLAAFQLSKRIARRDSARRKWSFSANEIVLLLIGNALRNKGLETLLEALGMCRESPFRLLVAGDDDPAPFALHARRLNVDERMMFAPGESDVMAYYAAADVLVAPSLEDSFNLPCLEAMACGLPVIVSPEAGITEWVTPDVDAIVLKNARDPRELAEAIRSLVADPDKMMRLGQNAVHTASKLTWDSHAEAIYQLLSSIKKN
jgi:glycosyltransferase involved in cell wall biosynthesis